MSYVGREERTPQYERAVSALRKLLESAKPGWGPDMANRAYAEATADAWRESYCDQHRVTRTRGQRTVARLWGGARRSWDVEPVPQFPAEDHVDLWIRDGKPVRFTSQPYGLGLQDMASMVEFCRAHHLRMTIRVGWSWHFPGSTLLVDVEPEPGPEPEPEPGGETAGGA